MASPRSLIRNLALVAAAALMVAACGDARTSRLRSIAPIPAKLVAEMKAKGMSRTSPVLVRIYKQDSELEVWKQTSAGRYALLKTYPICRWSGQLGPKKNEGDRQVPEGFYTVSAGQMNPNSRYYLSFDVGYPNAVDASLGRSGGDIMVHGSCSSRGCFAMTDDEIGEIYAVAREALQAGQPSFQVQSFPFRMTAENIAKNRKNPNIGFWRNLKDGSDTFEVTKQPVQVSACGGKYAFGGTGGCGISTPDPSVVAAVTEKRRRDDDRVASLVASGTPAVNVIYEDGGSNAVFAKRAVDSHAIPGRDRPYNKVSNPVVVALNETGSPASEADQHAASAATYSAAETLLMSEAAVARRPVGPQNPTAIATRQQAVYAKLMGAKLPPKPEPKVEAPEIVVASVAPASAAAGGDDAPFYSRWLSFASTEPQPAAVATTASQSAAEPKPKAAASKPTAPPAIARNAAEPTAPVQAAMAPATAPAQASDQPFYTRYTSWLGLGGGESTADTPSSTAALGGDPAASSPIVVPAPPAKPRSAALPAKKRPDATDVDTFTSLNY